MKVLHFLVVLLIVSKIGLAGTIDPNIVDQKYIDYANGFPFVGQFIGVNKDKQQILGSVVAHKEDVIITAAHVIEGSTLSWVYINGHLIKIKQQAIHENYKSNIFGYNDIAIGILEKNINLTWYPDLYEQTDEIDKICSLSGFGITGTFNTGAVISDNKKRAGSNKIDSIEKGLLICSPSKINKTSLEFLIASGDSGGGLFIGNRIAGIHSCVMTTKGSPNSSYGNESGHTRISDHTMWIRKNIKILKAIPNEKK